MGFKITLPKSSIIEIQSSGTWYKLTEHNRQPVNINVERIENSRRMANGTLRKYYVADKRTFSTSWSMLPNLATNTIDGGWAQSDLATFYANNTGSFNMRIKNIDGTYQPYVVAFTSFQPEILKRGIDTFYNLSIEMTEV
jgi:hypothetical protein